MEGQKYENVFTSSLHTTTNTRTHTDVFFIAHSTRNAVAYLDFFPFVNVLLLVILRSKLFFTHVCIGLTIVQRRPPTYSSAQKKREKGRMKVGRKKGREEGEPGRAERR